MASQRERVSFPGIIKGGGHDANCTMYATKVTLPGTSESAYTDFSIQSVSKSLPDGTYEVTARGETTRVRLQNGYWVAA